MRILWLAINGLFLAMFLFSVAVQYNDPDPVQWMAIYGFAVLACVLEFRKNVRWSFPAGIGLIAVSWAATIAKNVHGVRLGDLFQEFEMKNEMIEQAREMGGLLIVGFWMFILAFVAARRGRKLTQQGPAAEAKQHA